MTTSTHERAGRPARLILYVGKGGVGKTTLAAATAIRSADLGRRTLVVSTDPAHSLGDVLDLELSAEPTCVADRLYAQEVNVLEALRRSLGKVQAQVAELLRQEGMPDIQADELAILPGMEEVAALIEIERLGHTGAYDCIVVDAAPTGETMRLLSLPESFQWYATRVSAWRGRLQRLAGPLLRSVMPDLSIVDVMQGLARRVSQLRAALVDASRSSYRIVLTPDRTVLREAQRAETYLNLFEYPIDAVIANRVIPADKAADMDPGMYLPSLVARQQRILSDIHTAFSTMPVYEVDLTADEPIGLDALRELARATFGDADPTAVLHVGPSQRIERDGDGYILRMPMPNVEVARLDLTKRGNELSVELGTFRREVALPLALAALEPGVARIRDGVLEIPFHAARPDVAPSR